MRGAAPFLALWLAVGLWAEAAAQTASQPIAQSGETSPVQPDSAPEGVAVPDYPNYPNLGAPRGPAIGAAIPPDALGEQLVAGLSTDSVGITASFDGSDILIYGAVARDAPPPSGAPLEIIVTIEGPSEQLRIRRKQRLLGIWVNTESVPVASAPGFYTVATSGPLRRILTPAEDTRYRISVPLALRALGGVQAVEDTTPFTEALIRLRMNEGRYRLDEGSVHIVEQTLFRADVRLPTQLIEGAYKARVFLIRDGKVMDMQLSAIEVRKVGLERWLYRLALDRPVVYGMLSLLLAVAAGWGASAAFNAIRRK